MRPTSPEGGGGGEGECVCGGGGGTDSLVEFGYRFGNSSHGQPLVLPPPNLPPPLFMEAQGQPYKSYW